MKRLGASVDWDREYFTMDDNLSRAVREAFVRLYEEGLIYRGKYIVNWCPRCMTALSDLEVKHEDVPGKLYQIRYPVVGSEEYLVVATTRPETMLGDTAVAVNAKDERYKHLHNKRLQLPLTDRQIPIILDDIANPEFGTGAVKITPAHDANDYQVGLRHLLPQIDIMDDTAHLNENAGSYAGLDRFEARERVLQDLRDRGLLESEKDHVIGLGKCDRCKTVVEPRLSTQSFIKIARRDSLHAGKLRQDLLRVDAEYPRLVHLAAVVVGASHSGVALRGLQDHHGRSRRAGALFALQEHEPATGSRRTRHLVFFGTAAIQRLRLAGEVA